MKIMMLLALLVAGCSAAGKSSAPRAEEGTPPLTKDPGAVEDQEPLQPSVAPEPGPAGGGSGDTAPAGKADGTTCLVGPECASGVCEGEGCSVDKPGVCAPAQRACTRDLRQYCGCDGKSFGASGTCPGRRYAAKQSCP